MKKQALKVLMIITVTWLFAMSGSVQLYGDIIKVAAGESTLSDSLEMASDGDVLELVTGDGVYQEYSTLNIDKKVTIRARDGLNQKPVIRGQSGLGEVIGIESGGELTLSGVELTLGDYLIRVDNDATADSTVLTVDDSYLHHANKSWIKVGSGHVDSLIVTNSLLTEAVKEGLQLEEENTADYVKLENCTFIKTGRNVLMMNNNDNATVRINHCTFDSISYDNDKRILYPKGVLDVEIKNSIMTNQLGDPDPHSDVVNLSGTSSLHHSDLYNVGEVDLEGSASVSDTIRQDPLYLDPTDMDYRLANSSPAREAAADGRAMGDLRWEASPDQYKLTIHTEGNGVVEVTPPGELFEPGTEVTLTANPDSGWKVSHWEDIFVFPTNAKEATVTMDTDTVVTVVFMRTTPLYSIDADTVGRGHIDFAPAPFDSVGWTYYEGINLEMTAVSDTATMEFDSWSGDISSTENPLEFTVQGDTNITANFTPIATQYALDVEVVGLGDVASNPAPYADYGTYDSGTEVTLVASAEPGYEFTGWSGDESGSGDSLTVELTSDMNITATFEEQSIAGGAIRVGTSEEDMSLATAADFVFNNSHADSIILTSSGGIYPAHDGIKVTQDLTVVAEAGLSGRPIIEGNPDLGDGDGVFNVMPGDQRKELILDGVEITGTKRQVRTDGDSALATIKINDCYFHDTGNRWVKIYPNGIEEKTADSLVITNSTFRQCYKEGLYMEDEATIGYLKIENSTFVKSGRSTVQIKDNPNAVVRINNCTFDSISWSNDKRVIRTDEVKDVIVRDIIVSNQLGVPAPNEEVMDLYGESSAHHLLLFNASTKIGLNDNATADSTTMWNFDPKYKAPSETDYTLTAESHAYEIGSDGKALGDLRWAREEPLHVFLNVTAEHGTVVKSPAPVGMSFDPGTEVTLAVVADSGYEFIEWSGGLTGSENPATVTVDTDMDISALFEVETGIADQSVPQRYYLKRNYPNPFNPMTTIEFGLKQDGYTQVKVYNLLGEEVATLLDKRLSAGRYDVTFGGQGLPSGMYFYKITSGEFSQVHKMMLLK